MGIHKIAETMSEQDLSSGYTSYKDSAIKMGLQPLGALYSMEKGFAHCTTVAPSADDVRKAHADVAIPLEDVVEVKTLK